MNSCLERLCRELDEAGFHYEVVEHPQEFTAQRVAAVEEVPGHLFVKSVIAFVDERPCLLALPAPHIVDFDVLRKELGARSARLATEAEVGNLFPDCEVGAMPPLPGSSGIPVFMDRELGINPEIVFEAGSHTETIRMRTDDYVRFAQPGRLSFAREPAGGEPRSKRR